MSSQEGQILYVFEPPPKIKKAIQTYRTPNLLKVNMEIFKKMNLPQCRILLDLLENGPTSGYGISKRTKITTSVVYPTLRWLEELGIVISEDIPRGKRYRLTPLGFLKGIAIFFGMGVRGEIKRKEISLESKVFSKSEAEWLNSIIKKYAKDPVVSSALYPVLNNWDYFLKAGTEEVIPSLREYFTENFIFSATFSSGLQIYEPITVFLRNFFLGYRADLGIFRWRIASDKERKTMLNEWKQYLKFLCKIPEVKDLLERIIKAELVPFEFWQESLKFIQKS